jgi:MoxR-like ATPase
MQEKQVSVGTKKYPLEKPFFVLATQNPIEQEGTYALPEAQLDRFMYLIVVDYPETLDEIEVLRRTTTNYRAEVERVLDGPTILRYQEIIREVLVRDDLYDYAVRLVQASRVTKDTCHPYAKQWVSWGAGPRACQNLVLGAKAHAFFAGRTHVTTADIRAVALPVLRHRIIVNYAAVAEGIRSDDVVRELVKSVPAPADRAVA